MISGRGTDRGDAGVVGGVEAVVFATLILVGGAIVFTNAWSALDARLAVEEAATEAARAYVEAPDALTAQRDARSAALAVLSSYGDRIGDPAVVIGGGPFGRCVRVTVDVTARIAFILAPFGLPSPGSTAVAAHHAELVNAYRSGPPGTAACA